MFRPFHLLFQYNIFAKNSRRSNWIQPEDNIEQENINTLIRNGAPEDFLIHEYDSNLLLRTIMRHSRDLSGICIHDIDTELNNTYNFEEIDFTYADFYGLNLRRATFGTTVFNFADFTNCIFENCTFIYCSFYCTNFTDVVFRNCDFVVSNYEVNDFAMAENSFVNCNFRRTTFDDCFYSDRLFNDCKFDDRTSIRNISKLSLNQSTQQRLSDNQLSEVYKGIKEAYKSGNVNQKSSNSNIKQNKAYTRFNANSLEKPSRYFWEAISAYGEKPSRILIIMIIIVFLYTILYKFVWIISNSLLVSTGAFFTFGASSSSIESQSLLVKIIYASEAFLGIALVAIFITSLFNKLNRDR